LIPFLTFAQTAFTMKSLLILLLTLSISNGLSAQVLKKKYFGSYAGTLPGYKIDLGTDVVSVNPAEIKISISSDGALTQQIGDELKKGMWTFFIEGEKYFVLDVLFEGQLIKERVIIYKRGHAIGREGIFPQPTAILKKTKA
jgi:hypothetical protein